MKSKSSRSRFYITRLMAAIALVGILFSLSGCAYFRSKIAEIKGDLVGVSFTYYEYDSFGNPVFTGSGKRVNLEGVPVEESYFDDNGDAAVHYTLSSVVNITIDGYQHVACGSSLIFEETGLRQVNVELPDTVGTNHAGFSSLTSVASWLNGIKNVFGAKKAIIIKSELGYPLAIYEGDNVYWEVASDLPKTTRISIDGKALYIHRVEFDIIDLELLQG